MSERTTGKWSPGSLCHIIISSIRGGRICITTHLKSAVALPNTGFEARSVWKQTLTTVLARIQPHSPTRPLVVNGDRGLLWKFGKNLL